MSISTTPNTKLFGIDVSSYQGNIDWHQVKRAGAGFVFIKATEGSTFVDQAYLRNIAGARAANIPCGAYHFFRPQTSVDEQINNFVGTVGQLQVGDLQPVLDLEVPASWSTIAQATRLELVVRFLEGVKTQLGVEPIVYLSSSFAGDVLASSKELANYPLWVAHYTTAPKPDVPLPWHIWTFWQHSDKGTIGGVKGFVDMNWFNGSLAQLELFRKK
jgi:lysozyme